MIPGWLPTLLALHWSALVTPGANVLLVSQLAAGGQRRAAVAASAGIAAVAALWATLAMLGVAAVVDAVPQLAALLQAAGAAYLAWFAWRLWRVGANKAVAAGAATVGPFWTGVATNLANPKSMTFFVGIFLAVRAELTTPQSQALAVAVVAVDALAWHLAIALAFSRPAVRSVYRRHAASLGRIAAVVLAAVSVRLLVSLVF